MANTVKKYYYGNDTFIPPAGVRSIKVSAVQNTRTLGTGAFAGFLGYFQHVYKMGPNTTGGLADGTALARSSPVLNVSFGSYYRVYTSQTTAVNFGMLPN